MKYKVLIGDKAYKVKAKDYEEALKIAKIANKSIKDEASPREVIQQLIDDEASATAAYNIAIKNLKGVLPDESIAVLKAIRDDEERHSENLFAILSGNVTEKNLQDSKVKDALVARLYKSQLGGGDRVQILENGREIAAFTAEDAKVFANQIFSIASQISR